MKKNIKWYTTGTKSWYAMIPGNRYVRLRERPTQNSRISVEKINKENLPTRNLLNVSDDTLIPDIVKQSLYKRIS